MKKITVKNKTTPHIKRFAIFLSGIFIALSMVLAFSVETSMENVIQYIKQIKITYDWWNNTDTLIDLNSDWTWAVYMKWNVGINTSTPTEKLHVNWNTIIEWSIEWQKLKRNNSSSYLWLFGADYADNGAYIYLFGKNWNTADAGNLELYYGGYTNTWNLTISHQKDNWSTSYVVMIDESENVGIGTTRPQWKLDVNWNIVTNTTNFYLKNMSWENYLRLNNDGETTINAWQENDISLSINNSTKVKIINTPNTTNQTLTINWAIEVWQSNTGSAWAIKYSWWNFYWYNWSTRLQLNN